MISLLRQSRLLNRLRLAAGGLVGKDELADAMWPEPEEYSPSVWNDIRVAVHDLRRSGFPIRTIPGRGYCFAPTFWEVLP